MHEQLSRVDQDRITGLLAEQAGMYGQLAALSEQQRTLISGDDPDSLLSILSQRQSLVYALTRLNDELAPYRRDWNATYARLPEHCKQQVSALLDRINSTLAAILNKDRQDGELLAARRQSVGNELSGLSGGQLANASYGRSDYGASNYGGRSQLGGADLTG